MNLSAPSSRLWKRGAAVAAALVLVAAGLGFALPRALPSASKIAPALAQRAPTESAVIVRIATYNVRNYNSIERHDAGGFRPDWPKPEAEKAALRAVIRQAHPDILTLQEMGGAAYLEELRRDLAAEGLTYTYSAIVNGPDPDRHLAVLSRIEPVKVVPRDRVDFKYNGATQEMKRGLLELQFATAGHSWTLYVIHLKSRITEDQADPAGAALREAEARAVRDLIRREHPPANGELLAIAGDFNDTRNSPPLKRFLEVSGRPLFLIAPAADSRGETWTEYYSGGEQYGRPDYILFSPGLAAFQKNAGGVVDIPESTKASDHRLVWVDLAFPAGKN